MLDNKLRRLLDTINSWSKPKYDMEVMVQWQSDFKIFFLVHLVGNLHTNVDNFSSKYW